MMLCKVICQISVTGPPVHFELFLSDPVLDPVKSHVHGFGAIFFICRLANPVAVELSTYIGVDGWG